MDAENGKTLPEAMSGPSAEESAENALGSCICEAAWTSRKLIDPRCTWHNYGLAVVNNIREAEKRGYAQGQADMREQAANVAENSYLDWEIWLMDHADDANLISNAAFITQQIRSLPIDGRA